MDPHRAIRRSQGSGGRPFDRRACVPAARPRLSPRQIRSWVQPVDRHLGRGPSGLCPEPEGRSAVLGTRAGRARDRARTTGHAHARRSARPAVEARRNSRPARRSARRGRARRGAAHVPAPVTRHPPDHRSRCDHRAVDGESRVLRADGTRSHRGNRTPRCGGCRVAAPSRCRRPRTVDPRARARRVALPLRVARHRRARDNR